MASPEWEAEGLIWKEDYSLSLEEYTCHAGGSILAGCPRTVGRKMSDSAMLDKRRDHNRKNKGRARKKVTKMKPEDVTKSNDDIPLVKEEILCETVFEEPLKIDVAKTDEKQCERQRFRKRVFSFFNTIEEILSGATVDASYSRTVTDLEEGSKALKAVSGQEVDFEQRQQRFEKKSRRREDDNGPSSSQLKPDVNKATIQCRSQKDKSSSHSVGPALPSHDMLGKRVRDPLQNGNFLSIFSGVYEEVPMKPSGQEASVCHTRSESRLDVENQSLCTVTCFSEKEVRRNGIKNNGTHARTAKNWPSKASGAAIIKKLLEISVQEGCSRQSKQKSSRRKFRDQKGRQNNHEENTMHDIRLAATAADTVSPGASHLPREEKIEAVMSSSKPYDEGDAKVATADATFVPPELGTESEDKAEPNVVPDVSLAPAVVQPDQIDIVVEKLSDCSEEEVLGFIESTMSREYDTRVNRVLLVMADFLHPDGRELQDLLDLSVSDFYRLCSFYSHVKFENLSELDFSKADSKLVISFLRKLIWLCRSFVVGMLAESALLVEDHIDFNRLDLDLCTSEVIDERKEIEMLSGLIEDFRKIPAIRSIDDAGYFTQFEQMRDIADAFDHRDRRKLIQLGVVDTAERVSERIALGINVSDDEVMELLRDSIGSNFGEYTWLVESHPELISTMDHFDCIMESLPSMASCIDIRPLRSTMSFIPRYLSKLSLADRDSCVAKYVGKYQIKEAGQSWLQLIRDAEDVLQLSLQITTQFLFTSVDCGAEEFLGALLEDLPLQKKTAAIQSISCMPSALRDKLIPTDGLTKCGVYHAVQRMAEEMPLSRFRNDAVSLIEQLCSFSALSPSRLLSNTFFPMMSTSSKAKAAVAIAALVKHERFKSEIFAGTGLSAADLLEVALHYYEPTCSSVSSSRYTFIEAVLRAVNMILRENEAILIDFNAVFAHFKAIKWYHKFVILKSFFDSSTWTNVTFEYPWTDKARNNVEFFCEIPCILTAWPGDNSSLFESFICGEKLYRFYELPLDCFAYITLLSIAKKSKAVDCKNFQSEDAEVISRSMLLAFDRGLGGNSDNLHLLARVVEKLSAEVCDWERLLLEEEYKFQSVSFAQVFDCTGISFGFFDDEDVPSTQQTVRNAEVETKADFCLHCNASISDSKAQCQLTASHLLDDSVFTAEETTSVSETRPFSSISKSTVTGSQAEQCDHSENEKISRETSVASSNADVDKLLEEIIEKVVNMCSAPYVERIPSKTCQLSGSIDDYVAFVNGENDAEYSKCNIENSFASSGPLPPQIGSSINEYANDTSFWTVERSCLYSDWEQTEPRKEEILLDLRTFTWALDTIELWEYCPSSLRDKVLLLALESRCEVIRKRARLLKENDIDC